jgi:hypothetical protein
MERGALTICTGALFLILGALIMFTGSQAAFSVGFIIAWMVANTIRSLEIGQEIKVITDIVQAGEADGL